MAVVGSGPAGLACAQQLARAGHAPTVFEKTDRIGGLLRYGIPDFKMEKHLIDRRIRQMEAEGVIFRTGFEVGVTVSVQRLLDDYDVLVMAGGAEAPRDLQVPGRELDGVHFAMEFLTQQNKRNAGDPRTSPRRAARSRAKGKHVVVIGGGDTGSDCIGTSNRQGAASVTQLEIMPQPPEHENKALTWPDWPLKLRTSSSPGGGLRARLRGGHQAGDRRERPGHRARVRARRMGRRRRRPHADARGRRARVQLKADLVLLAMGFVGPRRAGLVDSAASSSIRAATSRPNVGDYQTSPAEHLRCGDMRRGQSLVVWAIREGRQCARAVDEYLMGTSKLPR